MSYGVLELLLTEDFEIPLCFYSTPSALRHQLLRSAEVTRVRMAIDQGEITAETMRKFVSELLSQLKPGERLPHEMALAALAVAMEDRYTAFALEYIHGLSNLKISELSYAIRVARECLKSGNTLNSGCIIHAEPIKDRTTVLETLDADYHANRYQGKPVIHCTVQGRTGT